MAKITTGLEVPQAREHEQSVLGAMLLEKNAVTEALTVLRSEHFYDGRNQLIFEAIFELFSNSMPVDILTVLEKMRADKTLQKVGGPSYLSDLTLKVASTAEVLHYAKIIVEKWNLRALILLGSKIAPWCYSEGKSSAEIIEDIESEVLQISEAKSENEAEALKVIVPRVLSEIKQASQNKDGISGVPTGLFEIDRITSGFQNTDLIILAGRPGMGKTALALSMARNIAVDFGLAVGFFSLEMSKAQLVKRLLAGDAEVDSEALRNGVLTDEELQRLQQTSLLRNAPLHIDDESGLSIFQLRARALRMKMQHDIKIIFVDYLQLLEGPSNKNTNREQEISKISRGIKSLAKELDVPIIALSQLSRAVESRGDKRPMLSDLRDSGAIEQDADLVCFIYRELYYKPYEINYKNPLDSTGPNDARFIISKHRNGSLGEAVLNFVPRFARFKNKQDLNDTSDIELSF